MCKWATAHFPSNPRSVRAARSHVAGLLHAWQVDDSDGSVVLLVSEVVTNAVRHAPSEAGFEVVVSLADGAVEVGVRDCDPEVRSVVRHSADADAESGRGLALVDGVADEWGTVVLDQSKTVWFRLEVADSARDARNCGCNDPAFGRSVLLASGRRIRAA